MLEFDDLFVVTSTIRKEQKVKEEVAPVAVPQKISAKQRKKMRKQQKYAVAKTTIVQQEQEKVEENLEFEVQCIDLFCLRVLSLLICRGKASDKAAYLASTANLKQDEDLSWDNVRLTRALKLMVYITSILPQKYMSIHQDQEIYYRILNPNSTFVIRRNESKKILNVRQEDMPQEGFLWTPEQIEGKEMLFEFVFEKFFEGQYLGKIYSETEGNVQNQDFIDKF